ncbi:hypothetical protein [Luteimonas sp. MC1828]|uniref:hypothetical protein n=1 Tax=Luteimonas sp. MC1828 TaxID=2799787 RepID=UPI0018F152C3|nr:hypothetical protein [Luteimonas sp. MC1828]MBJ7576053.1 hypothetical protein [Luteimonas sp. MC1828]
MRRCHHRRAGLAAFLATVLTGATLLQGCNAVEPEFDPMTPPPGHGPFTGTVADWPLWFAWHQFGGYCFDTQRCEIRYANDWHGSDRPQASVESHGHPLEKMLRAGNGPIRNFPPPAEVTWVSLDGTSLTASVDMAEIFADRMVRHTAKREDILEDSFIPYPGIILVVDGRTINVYMSTWMALKELKNPDNPHSDQYSGMVLVDSKTY